MNFNKFPEQFSKCIGKFDLFLFYGVFTTTCGPQNTKNEKEKEKSFAGELYTTSVLK
jgi:hypothetical protein